MKTLLYVVLAALTLVATPALATPGAVNGSGCHSKPKHCHSASDINTSNKGRHSFRYVPFGKG